MSQGCKGLFEWTLLRFLQAERLALKDFSATGLHAQFVYLNFHGVPLAFVFCFKALL